jgi:hypothetical protein
MGGEKRVSNNSETVSLTGKLTSALNQYRLGMGLDGPLIGAEGGVIRPRHDGCSETWKDGWRATMNRLRLRSGRVKISLILRLISWEPTQDVPESKSICVLLRKKRSTDWPRNSQIGIVPSYSYFVIRKVIVSAFI